MIDRRTMTLPTMSRLLVGILVWLKGAGSTRHARWCATVATRLHVITHITHITHARCLRAPAALARSRTLAVTLDTNACAEGEHLSTLTLACPRLTTPIHLSVSATAVQLEVGFKPALGAVTVGDITTGLPAQVHDLAITSRVPIAAHIRARIVDPLLTGPACSISVDPSSFTLLPFDTQRLTLCLQPGMDEGQLLGAGLELISVCRPDLLSVPITASIHRPKYTLTFKGRAMELEEPHFGEEGNVSQGSVHALPPMQFGSTAHARLEVTNTGAVPFRASLLLPPSGCWSVSEAALQVTKTRPAAFTVSIQAPSDPIPASGDPRASMDLEVPCTLDVGGLGPLHFKLLVVVGRPHLVVVTPQPPLLFTVDVTRPADDLRAELEDPTTGAVRVTCPAMVANHGSLPLVVSPAAAAAGIGAATHAVTCLHPQLPLRLEPGSEQDIQAGWALQAATGVTPGKTFTSTMALRSSSLQQAAGVQVDCTLSVHGPDLDLPATTTVSATLGSDGRLKKGKEIITVRNRGDRAAEYEWDLGDHSSLPPGIVVGLRVAGSGPPNHHASASNPAAQQVTPASRLSLGPKASASFEVVASWPPEVTLSAPATIDMALVVVNQTRLGTWQPVRHPVTLKILEKKGAKKALQKGPQTAPNTPQVCHLVWGQPGCHSCLGCRWP